MTPEDLTKLRKTLRLTQEQFALKLGITRPYLNSIESGKQAVSEGLILKVDKIFGENQPKERRYLIKYYDVDATASPMEIFEEENTDIKPINLDLPGFAGAEFAINVSGHALYPVIESGSMVICKKVTDKTIILYGEIYFIVTADYRFVRRLKKSSKKGNVLCVADNHNGRTSPNGLTYEPIDIPLDKIIHLYIVKGSIKRHQI